MKNYLVMVFAGVTVAIIIWYLGLNRIRGDFSGDITAPPQPAIEESKKPDAVGGQREASSESQDQPAAVHSERIETRDPGPEIREAEDSRDAEQERIDSFRALVNTGLHLASSGTNVGFVVQTREGEPFPTDRMLAAELGQPGLHLLTDYFKPAFKHSAHFNTIAGGQTELLLQSNVMEPLRYLLLGTLRYSCRRGSSGYGLYACDIDFDYVILDKRGRLQKSDMVSVTGPGATERKALQRGLELLAENHGASILQVIH